jgi:hypothetical protein
MLRSNTRGGRGMSWGMGGRRFLEHRHRVVWFEKAVFEALIVDDLWDMVQTAKQGGCDHAPQQMLGRLAVEHRCRILLAPF